MSYSRFTPEQLEKIAKLRDEAEEQREKSKKELEWWTEFYSEKKKFHPGDRVYVVIGGLTVIGYLLEEHKTKKWVRSTKSVKKQVIVITFDVSTPYGVLKNVITTQLRYRHYEDLSHVEIPEALKSISTQDLLAEVRRDRTGYYASWDDGYNRPPTRDFTSDQIRAELRKRPNVRRNKKVKKTLKKFM